VPLVACRLPQRLRVELGKDDGLAAPQRLCSRLRRIERRRIEHAHLPQQVLLARLARGHGDLLDGHSVLLEHVDDAPVAERRHREPRDLDERLLPVERLREDVARLGEEANALVG
jgi:hypothetical protein